MKHPHLTLRARLALVYGALFLVAGLVMLALTWALVNQQFNTSSPATVIIDAGTIDSGGNPAGATPEPTTQETEFIQVVDEARTDALTTLLTQGLIAVVLVGGISIWIGWLIAGRMLQPLATITATARRIADAPDADKRMHERIGLEGPRDEITELADTFDSMLARLDTSFDSQRRFIANASHELRTPLTLNRALLEVAISRPNASADVHMLGDTLLAVNARHERLIEGLLLLASSERELHERRFIDLADVVEHVVSTSDTPSHVELEVVSGEAPTSGDPVLLEQLVRNLLENGTRHNHSDTGWVRIETGRDSTGRATLEVSNSGPLVPPYEVGSLFEPFRRLDGERTAGAKGVGLGLSIVHAIAQAHEGEVTLAPRPEGGLKVTVALPGEEYGEEE